MTENEQAILRSIVELEAAVAAPKNDPLRAQLGTHLKRLRERVRALPSGTDPSLLHYLHKQSWEKARLFLQGREAENAAGNCGHVH